MDDSRTENRPLGDVGAGAICAVTVTYGDRLATLLPLLGALSGLRVGRVVVVGNGISDAVARRLIAQAPERPALSLVRLAENAGSAPGFSAALETAFADTATMAAWLLDDDNLPDPACLARLRAALDTGRWAAVTALRRDRPYLVAVARAGEASAMRLRHGQVFGHDLRAFPAKLWRKLARPRTQRWPKTQAGPGAQAGARPTAIPTAIAIPRAPYGGVLLPRAVWARIGGPRADFVLYADDLEFTERVAACGGARTNRVGAGGVVDGPTGGLGLVPEAALADAETSWNMEAGQGSSGPRPTRNTWRLARSAGDFRLFYAVRNAVYLDMRRDGFSVWLVINTAWFLTAVTLAALIAGRPRNAFVTARAVWQGVAGRLGPDPRFPLPQ